MKNKNRPDTDLSHASTFPTVHMLLEFQTLVNHAISLWLAVPRFPNRHLRNHAGTLTRPGQSIERLAFLKAPNPYPRIVQAFFVRCSSVPDRSLCLAATRRMQGKLSRPCAGAHVGILAS